MWVPKGPPLALVWRVRGWALSRPRPLVLSGVRPGPTTHWLWVRGVRAWEPVAKTTGCTLACWLCALWRRHEGDRGARLLPGCGASGVGRSANPVNSSFWAAGWRPLPTGCGCGGCGRGDPSPTPQRALLPAGFARCGGGMRVPGGRASCLGVGHPGSGALPPPTSRPFRRAAGAHYPLAVGAGAAGVGTRHQAEQRTRPGTGAAPQEVGRAWKRAPTPLASLPAHRQGLPRPGDGYIWTRHAWRATPAAPATKRNRRRPKTWAYGSLGLPQGSSSPWQSASDGCLLCGHATLLREPAPWQTSHSAIGRGTRPPPP